MSKQRRKLIYVAMHLPGHRFKNSQLESGPTVASSKPSHSFSRWVWRICINRVYDLILASWMRYSICFDTTRAIYFEVTTATARPGLYLILHCATLATIREDSYTRMYMNVSLRKLRYVRCTKHDAIL